MRHLIFVSALTALSMAISPASAGTSSQGTGADCTIGQQASRPLSGTDGRPVQASDVQTRQQAPVKCAEPAPTSSPDVWMLVMLALGILIIGLPAARRRDVPVVFS